MNSLRSLMAFVMTGKPNFASKKNTTPNESTIQKSSPGSGMSGFIVLHQHYEEAHHDGEECHTLNEGGGQNHRGTDVTRC